MCARECLSIRVSLIDVLGYFCGLFFNVCMVQMHLNSKPSPLNGIQLNEAHKVDVI